MSTRTRLLAAALAAALAQPAAARAATIFFGEDVNATATGQNEDAVRIPHPNADAARDAFRASLVGVATESFEDAPATTTSLSLGPDTATLSPALPVLTLPTGTFAGVYPTSGDDTLFVTTGSATLFTISFSTPQAAFGFYATDVEVPGNLALRFLLADGSTLDQPVPSQAGTGGANNTGSVLYFGLVDTQAPFTSVTFLRPLSSVDGFGFDDLTIGRVENVVPEPGSLALLGLGLAMLRAGRSRTARA